MKKTVSGKLSETVSNCRAFYYWTKELPKGKCILDFDGKTDIFKAKEVVEIGRKTFAPTPHFLNKSEWVPVLISSKYPLL